MDLLNQTQLNALSKVYDSPEGVTMKDLMGEERSLPGFGDIIGALFQNKLLEIKGASYVLTPLGRETYENEKQS